MTTPGVPSSSVEYLRIPVSDGGASIPGEIAVIVGCDEPAEGDWKSAAWDSGSYKTLIGPTTSLPLAEGSYVAWIRLSATPEKIVRRSGPVRVGP